MSKYDNTNRGVLRTNERKEKDSQPDWRGEINIDGKDYWLSAWSAEHPNMGGTYYQISVTAKDAKVFDKAKQAAGSQNTVPDSSFDSEEVPF